MVIYKATNVLNGKLYIGQTTRTLEERVSEHLRKNTCFSKAIKRYGKNNFKFEIIDTATTIEELNQKEQYWIDFYKCIIPNGYNQCEGGGNTKGFCHREESKRKMSVNHKELYRGENNPFYGKHHSEEQRKKWRENRKGLVFLTNEQIQNLRSSHYKRKVRCVETDEVFNSIKDAATKYNLKDTHITRVCKGLRKSTGGFRWEYVNI